MRNQDRSPAALRGWILRAAGFALIAFAIAYDWILGGSPGFGQRQWLLLLFGGGTAAVGLWVSPETRARAAAWLRGVRMPVLSFRDLLLIAIAFACATALLEGVVLAASFYAFGEIPRLGPHVVWMSALANALVLVAGGTLLYGLGAVLPVARTPAIPAFCFALLATDTVLNRISLAARADALSRWLLALGVAVAVARAVTSRFAAQRARPERSAAWLSAAVAVLALATFLRNPVREVLTRARLAEAAPGRASVLLIILDTVRAANLGLYGYVRPTTPQLERFAGQATVFDFAVSPSSWTLPSHATLFTGRAPNTLNADWQAPLEDEPATLAEVLGELGYVTAGFSANSAYANANTGLARGFDRYEDFPASADEALRTTLMLRRMILRIGSVDWLRDGYTGRKSAAEVSGAFLRWLDRTPDDRPFFAFLNYFDAHDPYIAGPPFDTLFGGPVRDYPPLDRERGSSAEVVNAWTDGYDRAIAYLDDELGKLFAALEQRGVLDETIVVVTADHGEHLGEHGYMRHGNTLGRPVLHVPLIVRYPARVPQGLRVAEPVSLRDVPATLLDLLGAERSPLPGVSLSRLWARGGESGSPVFSEVRKAVRAPARYPNADADLHSLVEGGFQYVVGTDGAENLYALSDTEEAYDLADADSMGPTLERLRARMSTLLGARSAATATVASTRAAASEPADRGRRD